MSAVRSVLALGSNLGVSADTLLHAVADLVGVDDVRLHAVSPVVRSKPVGGPDQPDYLNMVIEVETDLDPYALLAHCQAVEDRHHRERSVRWGPRTLDVDVITYGDLSSDDVTLTVPHPRAATRGFVLVPWAEMDPEAELGGRRVAELAAEAADSADVVPFEGTRDA